ncbi:MAG: DUF4169 family protein [Aliishimia sp.]
MKVVSLNKARKAKAQDDKKARADQNVAAFGRTKAEKQNAQAQADKAARDLDGHKRDP